MFAWCVLRILDVETVFQSFLYMNQDFIYDNPFIQTRPEREREREKRTRHI
jgi:hypothetical protein